MPTQGFQLPPKDEWEYWAVVLGVLAVVFTAVRKPCLWVLRRCLRYLLSPEIKRLRDVENTVSAHTDTLTAVEATLQAQGVALRDVPRMAGAMEQMAGTLGELRDTIDDLHKVLRDHGTEIGRVTGFVDGLERRRRGRRKDDPPLENTE